MKYEETPVKNSKNLGKSSTLKDMARLGTLTILWFLVKRHHTGLLITTNMLFVLSWAIPQWPEMIGSLFS